MGDFRHYERPGATALGFLQGGVFDHAVDNFGDSSGLVADWPALKCWRQSHPPAARGSRGCFDHQPRHRTASGLDIRARGRGAESPFPTFRFTILLASLPSGLDGVFCQPKNRVPVLANNLEPCLPTHLRKIDATKK